MLYVTRRERFCSAHRIFRPDWSDEKNMDIYGKCSNPNWHGHNYELFVTVKGTLNPETGFVVNLKELSKLIKTEILEKLDHKNINIEVDFMKDKIITTENIAIGIWEVLEPHIINMGVKLHKIKLIETENNYVEYYGN